ncbi:MAG: hypothetical protein AAFY82_00440 [Pseudomonadota bacterium]
MTRFWLAAVTIMLIMLMACATPTSATRSAVLSEAPAAPMVQVQDIEAALAQFMSEEGDQLILLPNRLDRVQLDYSVQSLKLIDAWLADIHTINKLQSETGRAGEILVFDGRGDNSVMFAGLYLGQVIRTHSELDWQWQRFDTFLAANPAFAEHYGQDPGLDTFILVGPQGAATPINTALKRVLYGQEESVHFIAQLLMTEVDLDKALSGRDLLDMDRRGWAG